MANTCTAVKPFVLGILLFFTFCFSQNSFGQVEPEHEGHHLVSFLMAFSFIPQAVENNERKDVFVVPTIGINYDYHFNHRWGMGLHLDMILQQYEVKQHNDELLLERSFPVALTPVATYHFNNKWAILAGFGGEFDSLESFWMITTGIDYTFDKHENWEMSLNTLFDYRINGYGSFLVGVAFSLK